MLTEINHNPDVLSCLANLSSDEVFTPPDVANQVLDLLPNDLWSNPDATFLDPCCKSGVFLREIAKRLNAGLKTQIPEQQERINHILGKQLFGIGITSLTALLARRSVYCSKTADGRYSITDDLGREQGNIIFSLIEHTWKNGKCEFCGASQREYDRNDTLETHAYQFIHTHKPEGFFNMKFDVIIGNPPYQLSDGGHGASAKPIYNEFVDQAKKLNPDHLVMIIPTRWYSGGKGLEDFRQRMLDDDQMRTLVDFPDANSIFPGTQIKGGVCYFHWQRGTHGQTTIINHIGGQPPVAATRPLREKGIDTFIRYNQAIPILHKVERERERERERDSLKKFVSPRKPFGVPTNFKGKPSPNLTHTIPIYQNGGVGYVSRGQITDLQNLLPKHKVFIPPLGSGSDSFPHPILGQPFYGEPGTACTETYLVAGAFDTKEECESLISYLRTRFCRFLVLQVKSTQHATARVYELVPVQAWDRIWTDEELYAKYRISNDEIAFIESLVRPME